MGRPKQCEAFPIDPKDLHDVDFLCGYFFNEEIDAKLIRGTNSGKTCI